MESFSLSDSENGSIDVVYELMHNTSGHFASLCRKESSDNDSDVIHGLDR